MDENEFKRGIATTVGDEDGLTLEPEDEAAMIKEAIFIKEYTYASLEKKTDLLTAYRYLYWACFRGNLHVANFILHKCRISPFLSDPST